MSRIANSVGTEELACEADGALDSRIVRAMIVVTVGAVIVSTPFLSWRFTAGLALGGALSLLNYRWLHSSVAAIFALNNRTHRPAASSSRYLLRYFVVGVVVFTSYQLQLISLPATLAGLCAFVPALMFEALREFYFAIIHREGSY
jgi:ATP synthase I subunit